MDDPCPDTPTKALVAFFFCLFLGGSSETFSVSAFNSLMRPWSNVEEETGLGKSNNAPTSWPSTCAFKLMTSPSSSRARLLQLPSEVGGDGLEEVNLDLMSRT